MIVRRTVHERAVCGTTALGLAAVLVCAGCSGPRQTDSAAGIDKADAVDVLLIVIDTIRADHVSAYGYARSTTPHIDAPRPGRG